LHIAKELDIDTKGSELIMVGDSIDDMKAGRGAGAVTILLASEHNTDIQEHDNTDLVITQYVSRTDPKDLKVPACVNIVAILASTS